MRLSHLLEGQDRSSDQLVVARVSGVVHDLEHERQILHVAAELAFLYFYWIPCSQGIVVDDFCPVD